MSDAPVSPSDPSVAAAATDGSEGAGAQGAAEEATGGASGDGGGRGLTDALLSTEPRKSPASVKRDLEVGDAGAHGFIGARKFMAGLGLGGDEADGTPAVAHFLLAAFYFVFRGGEGEDDDGGDGGTDEALEAVGGEATISADAPDYNDPAAAGGGAA